MPLPVSTRGWLCSSPKEPNGEAWCSARAGLDRHDAVCVALVGLKGREGAHLAGVRGVARPRFRCRNHHRRVGVAAEGCVTARISAAMAPPTIDEMNDVALVLHGRLFPDWASTIAHAGQAGVTLSKRPLRLACALEGARSAPGRAEHRPAAGRCSAHGALWRGGGRRAQRGDGRPAFGRRHERAARESRCDADAGG